MAYYDGLPEAVVEAILTAAAAALPGEACGVLLGVADRVSEIRTVDNVATDPQRFEIPAADVHRIQGDAVAAGRDIVGFWHSHPNGPGAPSRADLETALPGYLYVIADLRTGAVSAWRMREDRHAFEPA